MELEEDKRLMVSFMYFNRLCGNRVFDVATDAANYVLSQAQNWLSFSLFGFTAGNRIAVLQPIFHSLTPRESEPGNLAMRQVVVRKSKSDAEPIFRSLPMQSADAQKLRELFLCVCDASLVELMPVESSDLTRT